MESKTQINNKLKSELHLIAMPLGYPLHPSSQLGYLHGYVNKKFGSQMKIKSHHAFLPILYDFADLEMTTFFEKYSLVGEEILYLCCSLSAINNGEIDFMPASQFEDALFRYNNYTKSSENDSQQNLVSFSRDQCYDLVASMEKYIEKVLEPKLSSDSLNIIGFTASFCQVFGSIFAARHLNRISKKPIIYIFGGSSFSLPEGSRTLSSWGVDGLIVVGSGEQPLYNILTSILSSANNSNLLEEISSKNFTNVSRVGDPHKPVELEMSKDYMHTLPDPDYDDYFNDLRSICSDNQTFEYACQTFVSLPLEGSRGCFAKCDFCHNPNITSEFRSLTGDQVADRTLRLTGKYKINDVTFVDSVCNTWAEGYANKLLKLNHPIKAFMELRVHAPEIFWTKLVLSGAEKLQLGIEAISSPLLKAMVKGTSVMQNIAAVKYMAEMNAKDASNLIIHHPKSTVDDVIETKRIMTILEHFPVFDLSRFVVSYASPLYFELEEKKKALLSRGFDWLPKEMEPYGWPRHLSYTWPNSWNNPEVVAAWDKFQEYYIRYKKSLASREIKSNFKVSRDKDGLHLQDNRFGKKDHYLLKGLDDTLYSFCHRPRRFKQIYKELQVSQDKIRERLNFLINKQAVLFLDNQYLSIALRSKSELIDNYLEDFQTEHIKSLSLASQ